MKMRSRFLVVVGGGIALVLVVTGSWMFTESMVHATSGEDFCDGCHTMEPLKESYEQGTHGGNNPYGFQAKCVDCHLPHDNPRNYLLTKSYLGLHDIWVELTKDPDSIDWEAKMTHPEEFVYDSGCLHCHSKLLEATEKNAKAGPSHEVYFQGTAGVSCAACHPDAGHHNLAEYLKKAKSKE